MPVTLPIEIKEEAKVVIKSLEMAISEATEYKWAVTKDEIVTEFRKEMDAMRKEVQGEIENLRKEVRNDIDNLRKEFRGEIDNLRKEFKTEIDKIRDEFATKELLTEKINYLRAEIKSEFVKLDRKFTLMFIVILFAIIFLNQQAIEFLAKIFGILK